MRGAGFTDAATTRLISLHSFHGSRAARQRMAGIPMEVTLRAMYRRYTDGREPLTLQGVLISCTAGRNHDQVVGEEDG